MQRWLTGVDAWAREGADPVALASEGLSSRERETLAKVIDALGAMGALAEIRERHDASRDLRRPFHTWFDAFRTVKFVHGVRDHGFPDREWREAAAAAPFMPKGEPPPAPPLASARRA